ncbi:MAG TPA: cupin domain-containing protein [Rubrobacter sp.]|nr:cupin domain-containing protein [Rubrobacter sp.]
MSIDCKVSGSETGGDLLVIENTNDSRGGPPRHLHHEQEEWFYVVDGEYLAEIGDERYRLGPGDSVFAPRKIPHVWAHVGGGTGRLIVAFRPAGEMEGFFDAMSRANGTPSREELHGLFRSHGMEVTGPPLEVE